jgi:PmbA protein
MDYKAAAEQLVKRCLQKGADAAEVYLQAGRSLSVRVRNGEVETVQEAASQGVGFRVFVAGKMAFSNCNDLRNESLDNALSRAIEFARSTTADENNVLPTETEATEIDGLFDPGIARVSMGRRSSSQRRWSDS